MRNVEDEATGEASRSTTLRDKCPYSSLRVHVIAVISVYPVNSIIVERPQSQQMAPTDAARKENEFNAELSYFANVDDEAASEVRSIVFYGPFVR